MREKSGKKKGWFISSWENLSHLGRVLLHNVQGHDVSLSLPAHGINDIGHHHRAWP